jgi:hypothetical protein
MKDWKPVDIVILIITVVVSFVISMSVIRPLLSDKPMSIESAKLVSSIVVSLISIISIYVGSKLKHGKSSEEDE